MYDELIDGLAIENSTKIVFLVMDGLGGLQMEGYSGTELEVADTPNLDNLAREGATGLLTPIIPGVAPGSGPGHFALFGYDPVKNNVGRGVLSAAGLGFELTENDVAARINFATIDQDGHVVDRRAGRIDTETNKRLCDLLLKKIKLPKGYQFFLKTEKDHRALFVLRGEGLSGELQDTDPQKVGIPPLKVNALIPDAAHTAMIVENFLERAKNILSDEPKANMLLLRGFAKNKKYNSMYERYKLKCLCLANYPMYRGIARLVGMKIHPVVKSLDEQVDALKVEFSDYDFFFLHLKDTDACGEDGNFSGKVKAIEATDRLIPKITALNPDVLVVTGDHSTPVAMKSHSGHPVPVVMWSKFARKDTTIAFNENTCITGSIGQIPAPYLMSLVLSNALRLKKFGA